MAVKRINVKINPDSIEDVYLKQKVGDLLWALKQKEPTTALSMAINKIYTDGFTDGQKEISETLDMKEQKRQWK